MYRLMDVDDVLHADCTETSVDGNELQRRFALPRARVCRVQAAKLGDPMLFLPSEKLAALGSSAHLIHDEDFATLKLRCALLIRQSSSEGSAFLPRLLAARPLPLALAAVLPFAPFAAGFAAARVVGSPPPRL
jgi:hypothetical protein